ncbi:MAG: hypothetical protein ACHQDE_08120, partial [Acidimicrobiia bacterium]
MSSVPGNAPTRTHRRDLTPSAQLAAGFFRTLARTLKMARLYTRDNPLVEQGRAALRVQLNEALLLHGPWRFRITPYDMWLLEEPVVQPPDHGPGLDAAPMPEEKLPFLFFRDGIRWLTFAHEVPRAEFDAFFDALQTVGVGAHTHDDLVTLLWQANTQRIEIETVPFAQAIVLDGRMSGGEHGPGGRAAPTSAPAPEGTDLRVDMGQPERGGAGLHRDVFDDWPLPERAEDPSEAFAQLSKGMQFVRSRLLAEFSAEATVDWRQDAQALLGRVLELDGDVRTRAALAQSVMTWLARSIQDAQWEEARQACELLRRFDPDGTLTESTLGEVMDRLDADDITARLDESQNDDAGRFFALAVAIGRPAIDLACSVMALALKSRTRAAACTMLCYLCSDSPELLA